MKHTLQVLQRQASKRPHRHRVPDSERHDNKVLAERQKIKKNQGLGESSLAGSGGENEAGKVGIGQLRTGANDQAAVSFRNSVVITLTCVCVRACKATNESGEKVFHTMGNILFIMVLSWGVQLIRVGIAKYALSVAFAEHVDRSARSYTLCVQADQHRHDVMV